jgi:hypothetical protein
VAGWVGIELLLLYDRPTMVHHSYLIAWHRRGMFVLGLSEGQLLALQPFFIGDLELCQWRIAVANCSFSYGRYMRHMNHFSALLCLCKWRHMCDLNSNYSCSM